MNAEESFVTAIVKNETYLAGILAEEETRTAFASVIKAIPSTHISTIKALAARDIAKTNNPNLILRADSDETRVIRCLCGDAEGSGDPGESFRAALGRGGFLAVVATAFAEAAADRWPDLRPEWEKGPGGPKRGGLTSVILAGVYLRFFAPAWIMKGNKNATEDARSRLDSISAGNFDEAMPRTFPVSVHVPLSPDWPQPLFAIFAAAARRGARPPYVRKGDVWVPTWDPPLAPARDLLLTYPALGPAAETRLSGDPQFALGWSVDEVHDYIVDKTERDCPARPEVPRGGSQGGLRAAGQVLGSPETARSGAGTSCALGEHATPPGEVTGPRQTASGLPAPAQEIAPTARNGADDRETAPPRASWVKENRVAGRDIPYLRKERIPAGLARHFGKIAKKIISSPQVLENHCGRPSGWRAVHFHAWLTSLGLGGFSEGLRPTGLTPAALMNMTRKEMVLIGARNYTELHIPIFLNALEGAPDPDPRGGAKAATPPGDPPRDSECSGSSVSPGGTPPPTPSSSRHDLREAPDPAPRWHDDESALNRKKNGVPWRRIAASILPRGRWQGQRTEFSEDCKDSW